MGRDPVEATIGSRKVRMERIRGGSYKIKLMHGETANVNNPKDGKTTNTTILKVESNNSNRDYDRRGVITKGAIISIKGGKAIVTSRPGQDGIINARRIES